LRSNCSIVSTIATFDKVVVELGMGDGQLLYEIIKYGNSPNTCYVGIEIESKQIQKASNKMRGLRGKNIYLINDSFERILLHLADNCVDEFIFVLPPPNYIDKSMESQWILLYRNIYKKLKERGTLTIVTEIIDDLLGPVSDQEFRIWKDWLRSRFVTVGFRVKEIFDDSPSYYSSLFLDQFKGDQLRIKLITLILAKSESKSK
jgi:SAM-dependent methyltransferase